MLVVIKPGPLLTVQDLGRAGLARFGVAASGAMDRLAARAANALVGNAPGAPLLEVTGPGAELAVDESRLVALAGGDLGAEVVVAGGAQPLAPFMRADLAAGQHIRFRARRRGARSYLAVSGALQPRLSFGSAASDLAGGLGGGPLRASDRVPLGAPVPPPLPIAGGAPDLARWYEDAGQLRFVPAVGVPHAAVAALAAAQYVVSPRSNRSGYRLDGPAIDLPGDATAPSEPVAPGAIQVPPDGRPILLMADRQTVGGYPVIGFLAAVDEPKAAQLWPGDRIRFAPVRLDEAQAALRAQLRELAAWLPQQER